MQAIGRLGWIQIDAGEPMALAAFWNEVLARERVLFDIYDVP